MTSAEPSGSGQPYRSKMTVYVVACWIFAAFGGLMFGYDIGISGISIRLTNLVLVWHTVLDCYNKQDLAFYGRCHLRVARNCFF